MGHVNKSVKYGYARELAYSYEEAVEKVTAAPNLSPSQ